MSRALNVMASTQNSKFKTQNSNQPLCIIFFPYKNKKAPTDAIAMLLILKPSTVPNPINLEINPPRNAPTTPVKIVTSQPLASFPGFNIFPIIPATKPIPIQDKIPIPIFLFLLDAI